MTGSNVTTASVTRAISVAVIEYGQFMLGLGVSFRGVSACTPQPLTWIGGASPGTGAWTGVCGNRNTASFEDSFEFVVAEEAGEEVW